uniref:Uncharacterized protein n=1 Tax=Neogobius melanostomus TaxID=47308 RepID=A0A8C6WN93_9GOBI
MLILLLFLFLESVCLMEASRCSPGQAGGLQAPPKNVSIAPSSRLLSDCQYRVRQPLFTQHTPILKKSPGGHSTEQVEPKLQHSLLLEGQPPPYSEDFSSGDRSRISPILRSRSSTSVLQVHKLSTPVRPRLSSPVLHPRYTPLSTQKRTQNNPEQSKSSVYQAEYWACAIPNDPPPTPSGGNPHQDYEALLDYTYPLRSVPRAGDLTLQDSGIEMDLFSSGLSELNRSLGGMERPKDLVLADRVLTVDRPEWSKQKNTMVSAISAALITLPWDRGIQDDEDEEFRPLPGQIEQLQQLSQQVLSHKDHFKTFDLDQKVHAVGLYSSLILQVFSGHLEQLVHWLYAASQKIEQLAPPTVDIHSVKSSLAQYQSFQRDVNSHIPLTSSVLQTGRLLLRCIQSTSPVLRDTLLLIESQSRLLERHTEHFFSSILSAMDSLTQPQTEGSGPQTSSERGESTTQS